ncbi:MAG: tRNA (adenosine(37)-N6)-dimethylallyltransferase MiaA [Bacteroidota bacterium]|jgi:tRNA dimethylallyltransferase|nr:tRNA (adenosine(37)-N6)-dimethylallyltransferase MiaA [Bacteroidota bacterium]
METKPPPIIVLAGPTASGKTDAGIALARLLDAEIISADSRQVYRRLDIGTAKPDVAQRRAVPHHGIDVCDPSETYTAGRFFREAADWIADIQHRGRRVLVVGGSGLYLRAITDGIFDGPEADPALRARLEERIRNEGLESLVSDLTRHDPDTAARIDRRNPVRVIRALEVCLLTGRPYSVLRRERMPQVIQDTRMFGLRRERAALNARINRRVDDMIASGLVEEVTSLLAGGADPGWTSLQAVGYPEIIRYLAASTSLADSIDAIKRSTRQYARRQMTWFRKEARLRWIDAHDRMDADDIAAEILRRLDAPREEGNAGARPTSDAAAHHDT